MSKFCEMNGNINHIAEVSTSRKDGSPTGEKILTSINVNTGDVRDTLDGKFKKMDQQFQDRFNTLAPIPWTSNTLIKANQSLQVFERDGLFYLPNVKLLPFTTGAVFNADNWVLSELLTSYNGVLVVDTVSDLAVLSCKVGQLIKTRGYHTVGDGGGSEYIITETDMGYSFETKDKFATINDEFSILKFGIRSNGVLNQTKELIQLCNYVNAKKVYKVDFLNYRIQAPDFSKDIGFAFEMIGLHFDHPIHLCNLDIVNPKTIRQGMTPINITIENENVNGLVKLENLVITPWSKDYGEITSGYEDGSMHGIAVRNKGYSGRLLKCSLEASNIRFVSNAISYNCYGNAFFTDVNVKNISGPYLGLMCAWYGKNSTRIDNVKGVYRDDQKGDRVLVTNLYHFEPELGHLQDSDPIIEIGEMTLTNISSVVYTTGKPHSAFKFQPAHHHVAIKKISITDVVGDIESYRPVGTSVTPSEYVCDEIDIKNAHSSKLQFGFAKIGSLKVKNRTYPTGSTTVDGLLWNTDCEIENLEFNDSVVNALTIPDHNSATIGGMVVNDCVTSNSTWGIMRSTSATKINKLRVRNHELNGSMLFWLMNPIDDIFVDNLIINAVPDGVFSLRNSTGTENIVLRGLDVRVASSGYSGIFDGVAGGNVANVIIEYSRTKDTQFKTVQCKRVEYYNSKASA